VRELSRPVWQWCALTLGCVISVIAWIAATRVDPAALQAIQYSRRATIVLMVYILLSMALGMMSEVRSGKLLLLMIIVGICGWFIATAPERYRLVGTCNDLNAAAKELVFGVVVWADPQCRVFHRSTASPLGEWYPGTECPQWAIGWENGPVRVVSCK